jgi:signal-transduction protein with cAMP-binding, CBS, and nucleotidyltransferase domain
MKTGYKVCDAMTEKPVMVNGSVSLMDCANVMKDNHVGALIISDASGLHILTEQDIVRKGTAIGLDPSKAVVSEIMNKLENVIEPHQDIFEALVMMRDLNVRHLPVVNDGKMLGLLTLKDVLKIEPQLFDLLAEKFELKEEERKPVKTVKEDVGVCNICGNLSEDLTTKDDVLVCGSCKE